VLVEEVEQGGGLFCVGAPSRSPQVEEVAKRVDKHQAGVEAILLAGRSCEGCTWAWALGNPGQVT
jgi:hypothetical protein